MKITLSIVIPTKNREEDLVKCVDSISRQSVIPEEVLVIDDGQITAKTNNEIAVIINLFFKK